MTETEALAEIARLCDQFWPPDPHEVGEECSDCSMVRATRKVLEQVDKPDPVEEWIERRKSDWAKLRKMEREYRERRN